jgi:hypothetical protein
MPKPACVSSLQESPLLVVYLAERLQRLVSLLRLEGLVRVQPRQLGSG